MSKEDLRRSLDALQTELSQISDPAVKDRIAHLIEDIESQINEPETPEHGKNAQQRLPGLIEQFEADHPRMTESLNRLMVTLSGMGI